MSSESTLYTIGTALHRARENDHTVSVLVDGMWISGAVLAVDGFGAVLQSEGQHSVVRMESITAVTVAAAAPHRLPLQSARV